MASWVNEIANLLFGFCCCWAAAALLFDFRFFAFGCPVGLAGADLTLEPFFSRPISSGQFSLYSSSFSSSFRILF